MTKLSSLDGDDTVGDGDGNVSALLYCFRRLKPEEDDDDGDDNDE